MCHGLKSANIKITTNQRTQFEAAKFKILGALPGLFLHKYMYICSHIFIRSDDFEVPLIQSYFQENLLLRLVYIMYASVFQHSSIL